MTIPAERRRALKQVNGLFNTIYDAKLWPRVPRKIRQQIIRYGRHYPADSQIDEMCDAYDDIEYIKSIPRCPECGGVMVANLNGNLYCYDCAVREYEQSKKMSKVPEGQLLYGTILYSLWLRLQSAKKRLARLLKRYIRRIR